jgi:hypothetical protein
MAERPEPEDQEESKTEEAPDPRLDEIRRRINERVAASQLNDLQDRVAWILNRFPDTRDNDVTLALTYWRLFDETDEDEPLHALHGITRLTSIVRGRAKLQNTLGLFRGTERVRVLRAGLQDEEQREYRRTTQPSHPTLTVFMDETGKSDRYLMVGGLWALEPYQEMVLAKEVAIWKLANEIKEIHFTEVSRREADRYLDLVDWLANRMATFGFKYLAVERRGAPKDALNLLFYHLLAEGIDHEVQTGRCTLPRRLVVWKDREDESADGLLLADIKDRLMAASHPRYGGQLDVGELEAIPSESNSCLQVADLLLGSVNRCLNGSGLTGNGYKDDLARKVIAAFDIQVGPTQQVGGMSCQLHLGNTRTQE